MKALIICESRILLTVDSDDVYLLTGLTAPSAEKLLSAVIPMVRNVGFCGERYRLDCEIFEMGGSFSIFMTKEEKENNITPERRSGSTCTTPEYIYEFTDFENFLSACRGISLSHGDDATAMYDGEKTYICLRSRSPLPLEFGARECSAAECAAAREHCRALPFSAEQLGVIAKSSY
ncbi:MAG: hypothetical protein IJS45_01260 [Clostridia bacterium]|nr:hypothetical protein [Clostridia bacterium]